MRIEEDVIMQGALTVKGLVSGRWQSSETDRLYRNNLTSETKEYPLDLLNARVHDAIGTLLSTAGNDDLGIAGDTFGTNVPYLTAGDVKAASGTRYARVLFQLPAEYVSGGAITLRLSAGMLTTVSDTTCTIDAEVYGNDRDTTVGTSDICATSAQSINSLVFADKDFTITSATLNAGEVLDIRLAITYDDSSTGTAVIPAIGAGELILTIRG